MSAIRANFRDKKTSRIRKAYGEKKKEKIKSYQKAKKEDAEIGEIK